MPHIYDRPQQEIPQRSQSVLNPYQLSFSTLSFQIPLHSLYYHVHDKDYEFFKTKLSDYVASLDLAS